jgi:hypothetical protein
VKKGKREQPGIDLSNPEVELPEPEPLVHNLDEYKQKVLEHLQNKPWIAFQQETNVDPRKVIFDGGPVYGTGTVVFTITVPT